MARITNRKTMEQPLTGIERLPKVAIMHQGRITASGMREYLFVAGRDDEQQAASAMNCWRFESKTQVAMMDSDS